MNDLPNANGSAPGPRSPRKRRGGAGVALSRLLPGAAPEAAQEEPRSAEAQSPGPSTSPRALAASEGSEASEILRRVLPDIYFVNTPEARSQRHLELLSRLSRLGAGSGESGGQGSGLLLDFHEAEGSPLSECTVCAFDEAAPGLLAKLCGTMAALGLSVHTAFIYTLRLRENDASRNSAQEGGLEEGALSLAPAWEARAGRAVALNTFLMSESYFGHDRALTQRTQKRLRAELGRVLGGQSSVPALLSRSRRVLGSQPPLQIQELSIQNLAHERQTRILLRVGDSFGVLYRATTALAALGLDIAAAQVSTREEAADDLFFVTRDGSRLPDSDLASTRARLRALLQGDA